MTLLVGEWVEPTVKHTAQVYTISKTKLTVSMLEIKPGDIFMVYGSSEFLQDIEMIPVDQAIGKDKDQLSKYSVDPRLLRKIEGKRLRMLQKLYNDPKELSNRRDSRAI